MGQFGLWPAAQYAELHLQDLVTDEAAVVQVHPPTHLLHAGVIH